MMSLACTAEAPVVVPDPDPAVGWEVGQRVPDVALLDRQGSVSFADHHGEVLMVSLSAVWCSPCADLVEGVEALEADLGDEGFAHVTVLLEDASGLSVDPDEAAAWADAVGATGPVWADPQQVTAPGLGQAYPTVLVLDREGLVAAVVDVVDPSELNDIVEAELFP